MKRPILEGWKGYRKNVLPADASEIQLKETKQAFFAGAAILHSAYLGLLDMDDDPERDGSPAMQFLTDLYAELNEYGHQLDCKILGKQSH